MSTDRDQVIAGVLDLVPVDPPQERFWADLRARLRTERPSPLLRPVPPLPEAEALELRRTRPAPTTFAHRRRVVAGVVAAAVAAGAVLAVGALRDDRDDLDVRPPLDPVPTSTPTSSPSTTAPATSRTDAASPGGAMPGAAASARQVGLDWIAAVDRGDADAAWDLLGPQSREQLGSRAAFDDLMASALREGWGAWSQAGVEATAAPLEPVGSTEAWAVTFRGSLAQEGSTEYRSAVLLVRADADRLVVEPFVPGPAVGLIEGAAGAAAPAVEPGDVLDIAVGADRQGQLVAIDGEPLAADELVHDDDGALHGARVGDLPPGPHTLTVAVVTDGGSLAAAAQPFTVV